MNKEALAVVGSDGSVMWIPNGKITVRVHKTPATWMTSASYEAVFKYGSWTYDGFKLDVNFFNDDEQIDINDYLPHNNFELIDHSAVKNTKYYPCCLEPYPDLTFKLKLREL